MTTQTHNGKFHLKPSTLLLGAALTSLLTLGAVGSASAAEPDLGCRLHYTLKGWSAIYERADGMGTVTCHNGQSLRVAIHIRGGGLTAGKWQIDEGKGKFSDVHSIRDVLGNYAAASASAGVVHAAGAQVLTKGPVSLALAGTGRGVNLGISGTRFEIVAAK